MSQRFELSRHRREYHEDFATVVDDVLDDEQCGTLRRRVDWLIAEGQVRRIDHRPLGGACLHHLFEGDEVRMHLPELTAVYHASLPLIAAITAKDVVLSPHRRSSINIRAYPAGGGAQGGHYDANGITALLYLTTNTEAPLRMDIPREHPEHGSCIEQRHYLARAGSLLVMKGRDVIHDSSPTVVERKVSVVFRYGERGDTWRGDTTCNHGR